MKYHVIGSLLQWLLIVYVSSFSHCSRCLPRYLYCFRRPTSYFKHSPFAIYHTTHHTNTHTPLPLHIVIHIYTHTHTALTRSLSPFHLYHDTTTTNNNKEQQQQPPTSITSTAATLTK